MRLNLRVTLPIAILALVAAVAPVAGAADCSMVPGARCRNLDMRHLGTQMIGADMTGSDMRGADMRNMDLTRINLTNADLRGAKLSGATLNGANLTGTMMNGIHMKGVSMRGVVLHGTKLHMAILRNVTIDHAMINGADVRGTKFLGGGMTNSTVMAMRAGPMHRARDTRGECSNPTTFAGSGYGWAWENDYDFHGTTLSGNFSCDKFDTVTWGGAVFLNANFDYTKYYNAQNNSEQIVVSNVDFRYALFNSAFWKPGLAFHINLEGAWCPQINGDQSNAVWGRYNYTTPYYIGPTGRGIWKYGVVTSTAFGNIQFAGQPVQVSATDARLATINAAADGKRPYITLSALESKYPCYAQQAPDWLGGGY